MRRHTRLGGGGLRNVTTSEKGGGGVKKSWNSCDVIYGRPQSINIRFSSPSHFQQPVFLVNPRISIIVKSMFCYRIFVRAICFTVLELQANMFNLFLSQGFLMYFFCSSIDSVLEEAMLEERLWKYKLKNKV